MKQKKKQSVSSSDDELADDILKDALKKVGGDVSSEDLDEDGGEFGEDEQKELSEVDKIDFNEIKNDASSSDSEEDIIKQTILSKRNKPVDYEEP